MPLSWLRPRRCAEPRDPGAAAEADAESHLRSQGLVPVCRNYRAPCGEIDLIMRHGATLVFVEVRLRRNSRFGGAAASVTPAKQRRVVRTAQHYLQRQGLGERQAVRFDVVAMGGTGDLQWLPSAFAGI